LILCHTKTGELQIWDGDSGEIVFVGPGTPFERSWLAISPDRRHYALIDGNWSDTAPQRMLQVGLVTKNGLKEISRSHDISNFGDDPSDYDPYDSDASDVSYSSSPGWFIRTPCFAISDPGFITVGYWDIRVYSVQESSSTLYEEAKLSEMTNPDSGKHIHVSQLEISGDFIHAVYNDHQYVLWKWKDSVMLKRFRRPLHRVSFNCTSNYVGWLDVHRNSETSVINLLDVQSSEPVATISSPGKVEIVKFSALGSFVVTCRTGYSGTPDCVVIIDIWCTSTGKLLATVEDPFSNESLVRVDLSPLGNYMLLVSKTNRAVRVTRFWEIHYHGILGS